MALTLFASSFCTLPTLASPSRALVGPVSRKNYHSLPSKVRCTVATEAADQIVRRSANYQSSTWEYDFVQSLTSKYKVWLLATIIACYVILRQLELNT